ncbi:MAG: hypothetical protein KU38_04180 [Sulfurovum sp. FS08-3]|nr:MAG: hypothetical protein KU38_04180 [Sulfurovum sp. FS08-3]
MRYDFDTPIDRSTTNAEKYTKRPKLFGTHDVIPMWVADMDLPSPPCVIEALQKRLTHPILGYEEMPTTAFEAQMDWIQSRYGFSIQRSMMLLSPSVVASINIAIEAFSAIGDEIIVQPPIYPPFFHSITNRNRKLILNPLKNEKGEYRIDFEDLEAKITPRTKMLLLCSPHNPVGRVWSSQELETLLEITQKQGIVVVSDEVHSDIVWTPHTPLYTLSDRVVTLQGIGKTFNLSGIALSTIIIPNRELREAFGKVYDTFHLGEGNILSHIAFEAAYRGGKAWLEQLLVYIEGNFALLEDLARRYPRCMRFVKPQGTYLAWIDCGNFGEKQLFEGLVKQGLGVSMGHHFGKEGRGFVRLNCALPKSIMQEAIERLESFCRSEKF